MKRIIRTLSLFLAFFSVGILLPHNLRAQAYADTKLNPEERAADLVSRLTLEEKASLMTYRSAAIERLGIPAYNWWNEALHGVARNGSATVFPEPIGMAASFDDALLYEVFTAVSDEARVKHRMALVEGESGWYQGLTFWTPNINIFRDPRWGRGMETYGEDPYLTGRLGAMVVRGLQGPEDAPYLKTHACAKHFAVHSGPEADRHRFDARVSERDLRETYLPAFKELVTKANVREVMVAYNRFRGYPCAASNELINKILRGEWGYKGLITSDCWGINDFYVKGRHEFVKTPAEAAAAAVHAGVDTECGSIYQHIPEAVRSGLLDERDVDICLRRLIEARIRLGEFDRLPLWTELPDSLVEGPADRALARKMAEETLVLLKNDGILPLAPGTRMALIGPNADDREMMWGNYCPVPKATITLKDAMQARVDALECFQACEAVKPLMSTEEILARLEGIDIVVFAGGISSRLEGEEMHVSVPGFSAGDRTDIEMPQVQRELLSALHEAGKKVVLVNFSGSAIGLVPETVSCNAILQAWYPGEEGGTAIAGVLFGEVNPSGKLPVTFYRDAGQLPDFSDYDMKGHTYRYFTGEPLYPFGFGLSYTTFRYGKPRIQGGSLVIPVTNTGRRDGVEVVQLYIRRPDDPDGPLKTLRDFRRVEIPSGKTVRVSFPLTDETFLWWSEQAQDMVPLSGRYEILCGGSSAELQKLEYLFTAAAVVKTASEGLHLRFLGTGAADWNGRDERAELRRLSSVLLDGRILIDYTKTAADMLPAGCKPEAIFYTHSHGDHFRPAALLKLGVPQVYVGETWLERARESFRKASEETGLPMPVLTPLGVGECVTLGDVTVTALPANHATSDLHEQTLIYLVEKGSVRLLYATDTGGITAVAARLAGIDAHVREGRPITALVMEATMGLEHEVDFRLYTHSSVATVARTVEVLTQTGRYLPPEGQPVYLTHLARTLHGTQAQLDATLPSPLKAAYDGLEVYFKP